MSVVTDLLHRGALALLATGLLSPAPAQAETQRQKVLIVVSSEGRDAGATRPGFEMDEFSQAWAIFRDNGLDVDVASPAGGRAEADRYNAKEPFNARLEADPAVMAQLADTLPTASVRAADYAAVYVVGGKGAMFDLPSDAALQSLLAQVYQGGGVVGAVCHGPAALVDVRLADGRRLIEGRRMTGFTGEEESVFGEKWAKEFRFQLEEGMREHGARWEEAPLMMPHVVVDGRLVTGQNPFSTPAIAEAMLSAMGRTPAAREPWRDELSMQLAERALAGESSAARDALAATPERYHAALIGMLGYYHLEMAQQDDQVRDALTLMDLARPYMSEPRLHVAVADARWRLGQRDDARQLLASVLEQHPELAEAKALKGKMDL